ncbi:MAG: hypothetical protein FWG51_01850 [Firmicutes bacterium]|nr:hypothetical protein [Bacillota bacterium]
MARKGKGFFNLGWLISFILALFFIGWILAIFERLKRGNLLGAVLTIFGYGFGILWICDLVTLVLSKDIRILA